MASPVQSAPVTTEPVQIYPDITLARETQPSGCDIEPSYTKEGTRRRQIDQTKDLILRGLCKAESQGCA